MLFYEIDLRYILVSNLDRRRRTYMLKPKSKTKSAKQLKRIKTSETTIYLDNELPFESESLPTGKSRVSITVKSKVYNHGIEPKFAYCCFHFALLFQKLTVIKAVLAMIEN